MTPLLIKVALGTGFAILSLGLLPGRGVKGVLVAIGMVIAAAVVLHYVAP